MFKRTSLCRVSKIKNGYVWQKKKEKGRIKLPERYNPGPDKQV